LKAAGALCDRRGTVKGLRAALLLLLDVHRQAPCATETRAPSRCHALPRNCAPEPRPSPPPLPPLVLEHFRLRRWLRVGSGRLSEDAVVWSERIVGRTRLDAHGQLGVTRLDA